MQDLVEALSILAKYQGPDPRSPTHCEHDVFAVCGIPFGAVTSEDATRLDQLGFILCGDDSGEHEPGTWISFRFGSC